MDPHESDKPIPVDVEVEQPLSGHLGELRWRLLISLAAVLAGFLLALSQAERLILILREPSLGMLGRFAFFAPAEALLAYIKVAFLGGAVLAMPVVLWEVWAFVRSGLTRRERVYGAVFAGWGSLQFVLGIAFAYFVLLPVSLRFLLGMGGPLMEPVISIDRYLSFVLGVCFWSGVLFQLPVVITLLSRGGVVTPEWLRQQRPYAILALVTAAAILTPTTDVVNLTLMTLPLVVLYEISIVLARWSGKR